MTEEWLGLHVFYSTRPDGLLVDGVRPLVRELRSAGLIERYFFLRYWQEGPHIRLRVLPHAGAGPQVRDIAGRRTGEFLRNRPALYEPDAAVLRPIYRQLFLAEYDQERWDATYGAGGEMPIRPTNTVLEVAYEPEYARYGDRAGVRLAEWHFEHSSDTVLELLALANLHVRPVLLGQAAQLAMILCYVLFDDDEAIVEFFTRNRLIWENSHGTDPEAAWPHFERAYAASGTKLRDRITVIRDAVRGEDPTTLTPLQRAWVGHARQLRPRLAELIAALEGYSVPRLLASYLHMTNNRLGVTIRDEIYLSYLLARAVADASAGRIR